MSLIKTSLSPSQQETFELNNLQDVQVRLNTIQDKCSMQSEMDLKPGCTENVKVSQNPNEYWLYKPKNSTQTDVETSIINWLHSIFESPDSQFFRSKYNLLTRLEAIILDSSRNKSNQSILRHTYSLSGDYSNVNINLSPDIMSSNSSDNLCVNKINRNADYPSLNFSSFKGTMRAKQSLPPQRSVRSKFGAPRTINNNLSSSLNTNQVPPSFMNKTGSCDGLETVSTNVQEIAKIQEDILKAEVAALAAAAANRHGSNHSIHSLNQNDLNKIHTSAPDSPNSSFNKLNTVGLNSIGQQNQYPSNQTCIYSEQNYPGSVLGRQSSYTILPQKSGIPNAIDVQTIDHGPNLGNRKLSYVIPKTCSSVQLESRNQFGYRPLRKSMNAKLNTITNSNL